MVNGTVRENVALGLPLPMIDDSRVWEALARAHLDDFLRENREGLDTVIGESGMRLSGDSVNVWELPERSIRDQNS